MMGPIGRDPSTPARRARRPSLGELMLWIAAIAVCFWAATASPWLGIVAFLLLAPTLERTLRIVLRRAALGRPIDFETWVFAALISAGRVVRNLGLALAAYLVTLRFLMGILLGLGKIDLAFTVGGKLAAAVAVLVFLVRRFWAFRDWEIGGPPGPGTGLDPLRSPR